MGKLKKVNCPSNYDLFWNQVEDKIKDATHVEDLQHIIAWAERESKTAGELITHSCHIQSQCQELWNDYFAH